MNVPTHIACGALIGYAVAQVRSRCSNQARRDRPARLFAAIFVLGVASHLLLDLIPHYAWIVDRDWFISAASHWVIRATILSLLVGLPAIWITGRAWPCAVAGILGAMYPDIEKVAYFNFGATDPLILFDWHSKHLTSNPPGVPAWVLMGAEWILVVAILAAMAIMRRRTRAEPRT